MFVNRVKQRLRQGLPVVGHWLTLSSPAIAEILSTVGVDWLVIDTEHAPTGWETVEEMIRAMKGTEVTPLVRVVENEASFIKKALDRGAYGVVVPGVDTAEQAEAAVAASRFPPQGIRGVAGTRVSRYGADLPQYVSEWNEQVLVICQIESPGGVENADRIAAVDGVDVLFIGPNDLSASLGHFREFDHPTYKRAVGRILQAARSHDKAAGILTAGADEALDRIEQGFQFIDVASDARILMGAAVAISQKISNGLRERKPH